MLVTLDADRPCRAAQRDLIMLHWFIFQRTACPALPRDQGPDADFFCCVISYA
jgi:hypothetical protein